MTNQSVAQVMMETLVLFILMKNKHTDFLVTDILWISSVSNTLIVWSVLANCNFLSYCQHTVVLVRIWGQDNAGVKVSIFSPTTIS